jgi:S-DNA-T family DNA segregation ATPase FtsK/SpoIIIE
MHESSDETISVPAEPAPVAGSPFPVVASIAPVVASVVIWLLTRSPFVLIFAFLGPVIAGASLVDNRWSARRRLRTDTAAYRAELDRLSGQIDDRHAAERRGRDATSVGARRIIDAPDAPETGFARWRASPERRFVVVAGRGEQPSAVRVDGPPGNGAAGLRERARTISDVPVEVDASAGIGVVGPPIITHAFARGLLVQLCAASSPEVLTVVGVPTGWEWASALPHSRRRNGSSSLLVAEVSPDAAAPMSADLLVVLADRLDRIPPRCSAVIELTGVATAVLRRTTGAGPGGPLRLTVELISAAESRRFAEKLATLARQAGTGLSDAEPPDTVGFSEASAGAPAPAGGPSLSAVLGATASGPLCVDIVSDGPHAIVGGTTGSGKSELLVTWVTSVAERYPPSVANLLLVDFKGGAAFAPLLGLPHVVGVLTDLDSSSAARALESLRAEVRVRERHLRELGVRDIAQAPDLTRLVIVVDEFAAMLDGFPDLHALFVDIAARGRSLGMHLILCTQRPAGVVKDSLLANCGLRMSLRVNNRADSAAVIGTDAAAFLPAAVPGRLVLAGASGAVRLQVASTTEADITRVEKRWPQITAVRRPWLDPLPAWVERESLDMSMGGIRVGLADLPAEQRQDTAVWDPETDGSMLVIGMARTGKTTLLDTIAAEAARLGTVVLERIGPDAERAWDVVHSLTTALTSPTVDAPGVLVLVDDLDSLLAGIDADDAVALRDGILTLLRDGPRHRVHVAVAVQRLAGPTVSISGLVGSTVLLGTANRQEHMLAGGESTAWVEGRRPGSAIWRGVPVQLCAPETLVSRTPRHGASRTVRPIDWADHPVWLVVSGAPGRLVDEILARNTESPAGPPVRVAALADAPSGLVTAEQVRRSADSPVVIVGDSEQWQAHWPLLTALRADAAVLVEGCSVAEFRSLTRIRDRPPLLARQPGRAWLVEPAGTVRRVSVRSPATG